MRMLKIIAAIVVIILVVVFLAVYFGDSGGGGKKCTKCRAAATTPKEEPGESLDIEPRDYDKRIEYWNDKWSFHQYDKGTVEFDVIKECGLIVAISNQSGYPRDGYALILDQRGSSTDNLYDASTSVSYISRLPQINGPASTYSVARNVELAGQKRHVKMTYNHGAIQVDVDGHEILAYKDPAPTTGMRYIGFGHTGVRDGKGHIENLKIY